jgi:hypothetical protein
MSNNISNRILVWGPTAEVNGFVDAFLRNGFNGHVPIPTDAEPRERCDEHYRSRQLAIERWGTRFMYPGVTLSTQSAGVVVNSTETTNQDRFHKLADGLSVRDALAQLAAEGFEEYNPPSVEATIASISFDTPSDPPSKWIASCVDSLHSCGLRFALQWWDDDNLCPCLTCDGKVLCLRRGAFWSFEWVDGRLFQKTGERLSEHCAA